MALPSFSFGAEGVEYGRSSAYYATTSGSVVFPNDVDVKGNLAVEGFTSLDDTQVSGTLTVSQGLTGGTRTAYFTNGGVVPAEKSVAIFNDQSNGTLMVYRNNGNEGSVAFDGGVTGGQFVLTRPLVLPAAGGSSGNLTVGGNALVSGGIYGASLTTPASFPFGIKLPSLSFYRASVVLPDNPAGAGATINLLGGSGLYTGLDPTAYYLMTVSAAIQNTTSSVFPAGLTNGAWLLDYGAFTAPGQTQLAQAIYQSGLINVSELVSPLATAGGNGNVPINFSAIVQPAANALSQAPTVQLQATGGTNTNAGSATLYGLSISFVRVF
jgi:hypothetical protein